MDSAPRFDVQRSGRASARVAGAFLCIALPALFLIGCQTTEPVYDPVTLEHVVELSHQGASAATIANVARARGLDFPLTVDNILWLREQGVPNPAIEGLLDAERALQAQSYAQRPRVSVGLGFGYYGGHRHYGHRYRGYRGYGRHYGHW